MEISNLAGLQKGKSMKGDSSSHIVRVFQEEVDASLTWEFVRWMREVTDLPIFVKVRGLLLATLAFTRPSCLGVGLPADVCRELGLILKQIH